MPSFFLIKIEREPETTLYLLKNTGNWNKLFTWTFIYLYSLAGIKYGHFNNYFCVFKTVLIEFIPVYCEVKIIKWHNKEYLKSAL